MGDENLGFVIAMVGIFISCNRLDNMSLSVVNYLRVLVNPYF